jgi:uncharacterized protein (TIGR02145 family)
MNKLILAFIITLSFLNAKCQNEIVTDIEENEYKTIQIGNQIWMAENLRVTNTANGDKLTNVFDPNGNDKNVGEFGKLYRLESALKTCPKGWHVPTEQDWEVLIRYLGGKNNAGGKIKSVGTKMWHSPNTEATNESGFNALPAGMYDFTKVYQWFGKTACFLSSTKTPGYVKCFFIDNSSGILKKGNFHPNDAASVRLVKD